MSPDWRQILDHTRGVVLSVDFEKTRRRVITYAVVLLVDVDGDLETVRVYDGVHGRNELHRYTRSGGKQPPEAFHAGTLGEGMREAIDACLRGYSEMIEGWNR